jgi:hypothetical protein
MTTWIIIAAGYVAGMGLFQLLGGLGAAGRAFERWGATSSSLEAEPASPSG